MVGFDARHNSHRYVSTTRSEGGGRGRRRRRREGGGVIKKAEGFSGGKDFDMIMSPILSPLLFCSSALNIVTSVFVCFSLFLLQICSADSNHIPQQRIHCASLF